MFLFQIFFRLFLWATVHFFDEGRWTKPFSHWIVGTEKKTCGVLKNDRNSWRAKRMESFIFSLLLWWTSTDNPL